MKGQLKRREYTGEELMTIFIAFVSAKAGSKERNVLFFNGIKPTVDRMLKNAFFKFGRNRFNSTLQIEPIDKQLQKDISQECYEAILNKITKAVLFEVKNINKYLVTLIFNQIRMHFRKGATYHKHMNQIQRFYEDHLDTFGVAYGEGEVSKSANLDRELSEYRININYDDPASW
jgi:hypothetical protein